MKAFRNTGIVRASSLMPIRSWVDGPGLLTLDVPEEEIMMSSEDLIKYFLERTWLQVNIPVRALVPMRAADEATLEEALKIGVKELS